MDSGNSGSMQSSSGGDEEFDSRTERFSSFLNSSSHVGGFSSNPQPHPPPPSHHHNQQSSLLFDPLTSYLDVFSRSTPSPTPNSLLNLDIVWPRTLRSEPNCTQTSGLIGSSSSSSTQLDRTPFPNPSDPDNGARVSVSSDPVRNTKKRSRASRRAPTTVLTTDTSNFRAMVQEFTGIPAPPFSASASPFPRSRLDLFNSASTMRSGHFGPPPPYLLRPFAHKVQQPSFVSSTAIDAIVASTNSTPTSITTNASNSTSTNNYQLPSELGLHKQSPNLLNMENPMNTFQSLLQSPPNKFPFGTKISQGPLTIPSTDSRLKVGVLEEFGTNIANSDGMSLRSNDNWSTGGMGSNDGDQSNLRTFSGNYASSQRVSSCKMNFSTSSSDFHADKGSENVSSRGEGMVDSWICSSD